MAKDIEIEIFLAGGRKFKGDMKGIEDATEKTGQGFSKTQARLLSLNAGFQLLSGTIRTATRAIRFLTDIGSAAVQAGSDFEEANQKFGVVFGSVAAESAEMRDELVRNFGLSTVAATELLSATGDLLTGFGFTDQAALVLATDVNKLAVDLASFSNLQGGSARASEILTKALLGERDSLISLGVKVSEAEVQQRLFENGQNRLSGTALRAAKAQATFALILEQTTKAQGDFARSSDSLANQQRILEARLEDISTELGQILVPITQVFIKQLILLAEETREWIDANKEVIATNIITFAKTLSTTFGLLLDSTIFLINVFNDFLAGINLIKAGFASLGIVASETMLFITEAVGSAAQFMSAGFNTAINEIKTTFLTFLLETIQLVTENDFAKLILPDAAITTLENGLGAVKKALAEAVEPPETGENVVSTALEKVSSSLRENIQLLQQYKTEQEDAAIDTSLNAEALETLREKISNVNTEIFNGLEALQAEIDSGKTFEEKIADEVSGLEGMQAARDAAGETQLDRNEQLLLALQEQFNASSKDFADVGSANFNTFSNFAVSSLGTVKNSADDLFTNMILGTANTREAFRALGVTLLKNFVAMLTEMLIQRILFDKAEATVQQISARSAILADAAQGAAAAASSALQALPYPANIAAAAASSAAEFAAISAWQAAVPVRGQAGIDTVRRAEQPALLHLGETVLTRDETSILSDFLREAGANTGEAAGVGGGVNVTLEIENMTLMSDDDEALGDLATALRRQLEEQNVVSITS